MKKIYIEDIEPPFDIVIDIPMTKKTINRLERMKKRKAEIADSNLLKREE